MDRFAEFLTRHGVLLFAVGLAGASELLFTVEWSFPGCNDLQDGPASAVYGFPFPYLQWTRVSSLEFGFVPQLYLANLGTRTLAAFFVLRALIRRVHPESRADTRLLMASAGIVLCGAFMLVQAALLCAGFRQPVAALWSTEWSSYTELRPVGLGTSLEYDCSAYDDGP